MHELSRRWVFEHRPCVELGVIIQSNLIFVVWCVRRARRGRVGRVEFVPGADVCVKRRVYVALTLNIVIPSIHAIFLHLTSRVYRAAPPGLEPGRSAVARPRGSPPAPRVATTTAHTEPPPALSFRFTLGSISRHLGHCRVIGHVGRAGTTPLKKPGQSDVVVSWCGAAVGAATEKETATLCALP
jgi:hypothetical protein